MPAFTAEIAHLMGLGPLGFLALRKETRPEYRWLAAAFALSFVSDSLAHVGNPWLWSAIYPVGQAALVAAVVAPRLYAQWFLGALVVVGVLSVALLGLRDSTVPLRIFAWGWLCGVLWPLPLGRLRLALLVSFGGGLLGWLGFLLWPIEPMWALNQGIRAAGIGLFCWASMDPRPRLRLA